MEENNKELIENVLKKDNQDIDFEPIPEENVSPLSQPVVKKSNTSGDVTAAKTETAQTVNPEQNNQGTATTNTTTQAPKQEQTQQTKEEVTDAPEQEINADPGEQEQPEKPGQNNEEFAMPLEHAQLMADSIIGSINNTVLEVGCGYFVTISKHKDFYDFEELIQVIDEQNVKNIKRMKLDEEDKALLRPLLIHILRKKAAALSPEKQLLMVAFSILIKKAKVVMEIRAENEMLVERIRDIIRQEVRGTQEDQNDNHSQQQEEEKTEKQQNTSETNNDHQHEMEETIYEEVITTQTAGSKTGLPDEALETFK